MNFSNDSSSGRHARWRSAGLQPAFGCQWDGTRCESGPRGLRGDTKPTSCRRSGVVLVITLILLSVITFTAITFVILARREKGAVATSTDQTISKLAAETALERVQAEILANMMATTNKFAYDLIVSTNYINPHGFIPNDLSLTNVNYDYKDDGTANFSAADWEVLIANLFHDPRPPVFVYSDRRQTNTPDFRFYLDLNQNGVFETNGPVGLLQNGISLGITNRMLGDPEWIGILERPDEPHSASNRFTARYA